MTKNHNVVIGVGFFVGIGVQALILHPGGAQKIYFYFSQNCSILIEYNWINRKNHLQIKYNVDTCTIFTCKIVRKYCQNRDFSKLHAEPKN